MTAFWKNSTETQRQERDKELDDQSSTQVECVTAVRRSPFLVVCISYAAILFSEECKADISRRILPKRALMQRASDRVSNAPPCSVVHVLTLQVARTKLARSSTPDSACTLAWNISCAADKDTRDWLWHFDRYSCCYMCSPPPGICYENENEKLDLTRPGTFADSSFANTPSAFFMHACMLSLRQVPIALLNAVLLPLGLGVR